MNSILIWETFNTNLPIKQNLIGCWSFCSEVRSSLLELGYIRIFICFGEIICFDRPTGVWGSFSQANTDPGFVNNALIWNNRNSDNNKFDAADKILKKFFSIFLGKPLLISSCRPRRQPSNFQKETFLNERIISF